MNGLVAMEVLSRWHGHPCPWCGASHQRPQSRRAPLFFSAESRPRMAVPPNPPPPARPRPLIPPKNHHPWTTLHPSFRPSLGAPMPFTLKPDDALSVDADSPSYLKEHVDTGDRWVLNFGPQHPATH